MASSDNALNTELVIRIMRASSSIQSHFQLLLWLQGAFQEAVPHDVLISFSGANNGEVYHYDIVSAMTGVRTTQVPHSSVSEFINGIYRQWKENSADIGTVSLTQGCGTHLDRAVLHASLQDMKHVLFHAVPDARFKAEHLYILLRREGSFSESEQKHFELLLPHLDTSMRKIDGLPVIEPEQIDAPSLLNSLIQSGLSTREMEILEWVRSGKTNIEIGMILEISPFTVKNHLQRIYRKINVSNRAQAVGKIENIIQFPTPEAANELIQIRG